MPISAVYQPATMPSTTQEECDRLRVENAALFFLANDLDLNIIQALADRADKAERQAALNLEALNKERETSAGLQLRAGELEQELEEARKDIARLDWIDAHGLPIAEQVDGSYKVGDVARYWGSRLAQLKIDDATGMYWVAIAIRAAIDAAMKKHR